MARLSVSAVLGASVAVLALCVCGRAGAKDSEPLPSSPDARYQLAGVVQH